MNADKSLCDLAAQAAWPIDRIKDHVSKIGSGITPTGGKAKWLESLRGMDDLVFVILVCYEMCDKRPELLEGLIKSRQLRNCQ
jgi:hypothetical protein